MTSSGRLQYASFSSSVDIGFWHAFNKKKLEELKLSTDPVPLYGSYVNTDESGQLPRFSVLYSAFSGSTSSSGGELPCSGLLLHTNTIEEFKASDRKELLSRLSAELLWQHIKSGEALQHPQLLVPFFIHLFADLKKYRYLYWFAFPAYISHKETLVTPVTTLQDEWTQQQIEVFMESYNSRDAEVDAGFFVLQETSDNKFVCHPLTAYSRLREQQSKVRLVVADPSNIAGVPGWPLRNLLTLAHLHWPAYDCHDVLCLRLLARRGQRSIAHSLTFRVRLEPRQEEGTGGCGLPPCVGWEKNGAGHLAPFKLDLSATMDPKKVCDSACELTLQLMRWRVVPSLDVEALQNTRCLLLGAGTLGCNVARALMGWGMTHFTLVDSGRVSFSNPVRQSLYSFSDCLQGGELKAPAAARALKLIRPSVVSEGVVLTIPMPGHPPGHQQEHAALATLARLEQLIADHDVVFLLTDSRESRWLPALIGASLNKIVITAALGFDSFVVIRHGSKPRRSAGASAGASASSGTSAGASAGAGADEAAVPDLICLSHGGPHTGCGPADEAFDYSSKLVPGRHLGCYFCNDVSVPGNSQEDRTLDQQCTVSRPGVSMMAAAHAAEMLASLLQHPLRGDAPSGVGSSEGVLGAVPHSVRLFLSTHHLLTPTTPAFTQCSACGYQILSAYDRDGPQFVLQVLNSPRHLEEQSGIALLKKPLSNDELSDDFSAELSLSDEDGSI
ncbi:THIF-type NAD/FAD binding fold [Trinorchestia longiramus]|nr:THIF-type NAD/FAD binding fold [Trinorchestia longiramus]